jgi:hypothetical protein
MQTGFESPHRQDNIKGIENQFGDEEYERWTPNLIPSLIF